MPRQADPNSRPGILRGMEVGDEFVDSKLVDAPAKVAPGRKALANSWAGAITRVPESTFATETYQVVTDAGKLRIFIVITRIA